MLEEVPLHGDNHYRETAMSIPLRWFHTSTTILACCVLGLAGCANTVDGTPVSQLGNAYQIAGLPVVDGPSGLRPHPTSADRAVRGTDSGQMDRLAVNAIADIEDFWQRLAEDILGHVSPCPVVDVMGQHRPEHRRILR